MNIEDQESFKIIKVKQVLLVHNKIWSLSMICNQQGQTLIAGYSNLIKTWSFFNTFKQLRTQNFSGSGFTQIVFSKKINWFASSHSDYSIKCWKQSSNLFWLGSCIQKHKTKITFLLLNKNEDELLTSGYDNTIRSWKVDCQSNLLEYYYTLDIKHKGGIFCMSLNKTENNLVSCSGDKKIILWGKDQDGKWKFQSEIINADFGKDIFFIRNGQVVFKYYNQDIFQILEIQGEQMATIYEKNLNTLEQKENFHFPTVYIEDKDIFIQNHKQYLYFFQFYNSQLQVISDRIEVREFDQWSNLTFLKNEMENGGFIVRYTGSHNFLVYIISYK